MQALPGIGDPTADEYDPQEIVDYREGQYGPFDTIGELLNLYITHSDAQGDEMDLERFSKISNLITTKSKIFTIISQGQALRRSDKGTELAPDGELLRNIRREKIYSGDRKMTEDIEVQMTGKIKEAK